MKAELTAWVPTESERAAFEQQSYFVREGFAGPTLATEAAAEVHQLYLRGIFRKPGLSRGAARRALPEIRGDEALWLTDEVALPPALVQLREIFESLRRGLNQFTYLGLGCAELQLARYSDGAGYQPHRDAFAGGDNRKVTALYYLNPDWQPAAGGILRMHLPTGPVDVAPVLDRLVVFLSEAVEHEVLPAWTERLALTAWYSARRLDSL